MANKVTATLPGGREVMLEWTGERWEMRFERPGQTTELALTPEAMDALVRAHNMIVEERTKND